MLEPEMIAAIHIQGPGFEQMLATCAQQLLSPAATIFAVQRVYGGQIRDLTMQAYGLYAVPSGI